ncbi:Efg1 domain-containing protein [Aspergillus clavatus NRRL 1]|uniref:rRNA-processing protein efg1 n=1 Tax=Aspergillus clavatus (strain ATCC 1007 / CBS 513.65 / DSM 816 / NCTC 3887 / NRRL 1 / QM 1276 / 107) TaxID=344612 RepID=EFG1P_ASPCL|nr:nuclear protein involved in pre-rRNA processing, putative [Aspergillus clavatus NRRL 1]A1CF47.1 RecName: Full=rRNA-processing protein efg1 [Aspergillus clavatus NRRL 1]EAW11496.1 nuclear protein involved in pre-rRNA processing, putative [Aspergillus clavatus NRRL 1]
MPREFDPRAASKRKHGDTSEDFAPAKKKKILPPKHEHNHPSVNELKKRIRDVKRLLNRVDLPADARIIQERALAGYEKDLEDELARRNRSQMIKKYHFVRFLDRKAATKDLNRLLRREKEISKSDADSATKDGKLAALAKEIHVARVNQNYTIYYPLTQKYIALYAEKKQKKDKKGPTASSDNQSQSDSDGGAGAGSKLIFSTTGVRPPMWQVVEKCMEEGTLDLLREGKLDAQIGGADSPAPESKAKVTDDAGKVRNQDTVSKKSSGKSREADASKSKQDKKSKRAPAKEDAYRDAKNNDNDDGDESDGGFFEI